MIVDGELQMSNSNNTNPDNYSINVVGNYKIHTDGQLEGQRLLLDPANPTAVPLDKFEEYTGQLTMGGPFADIPTDYYAAKFGTSGEYFVILEVKDVLLQAYNLSSTWIRSQNTLPSAIVPTIGTSIQGTCVIENGGTKSVGTYFIEDLGSGGELKIYAGLNNDLFTGGPISFFTLYITYRV